MAGAQGPAGIGLASGVDPGRGSLLGGTRQRSDDPWNQDLQEADRADISVSPMARRDLRSGQPRGRKPLLADPQITLRFVAGISAGLPLVDACALAGVSYQSVRSWTLQGQAARDRADAGAEPEPWDDVYAGFLTQLEAAQADLASRCLDHINQAAAGGFVVRVRRWQDKQGHQVDETEKQPPQWQAARWLLERTRREAFGAAAAPFLGAVAAAVPETSQLMDESAIAADLAARIAQLRERAALEQAAAADLAGDATVVQDGEATT